MPSIINNELYRKINNNNSIRDNHMDPRIVSDAVVVDLAVKFIVYILLIELNEKYFKNSSRLKIIIIKLKVS